jgi:hypothetical protein
MIMVFGVMDYLPNDIDAFEASVSGMYIATDAVESDKILRSMRLDRKKVTYEMALNPSQGRRYPMRLLMIATVVILLAGCAIVPLAPYGEHGPSYPSRHYAPPAHSYYGYGDYGPRHDDRYQGREYNDRGGHGQHR